MDDDLAAAHAAVELGRRHWHQLPPALHVRTLHVLCADLLSLGAVRGEVNKRVDAITQLQVGGRLAARGWDCLWGGGAGVQPGCQLLWGWGKLCCAASCRGGG
jgi:hypothetical protein